MFVVCWCVRDDVLSTGRKGKLGRRLLYLWEWGKMEEELKMRGLDLYFIIRVYKKVGLKIM